MKFISTPKINIFLFPNKSLEIPWNSSSFSSQYALAFGMFFIILIFPKKVIIQLDTLPVIVLDSIITYKATATITLIINPSSTKCWSRANLGNRLKVQLQATAITPYITRAVW